MCENCTLCRETQHIFIFLQSESKSKLSTKSSFSSSDIQDPLQTTSQYLIQQAETTVDEETLPGKLPETPLRIEPPSSYKVPLFVCLF